MTRWLTLTMVVLAGCSYLPSLGPDYEKVEMALPSAYVEGAGLVQVDDKTPYWQRLGDPLLTTLEQRAMEQSLSIQQAWLTVKAARAGLGMAESALGPQVSAQGSYTGQRIGAKANLITGRTETLDIFAAGVGASWELDILGGTRRAVEAAEARADAAQAQADGTRSAVLAEVARQYVTYRALQQQVALVRETVSRSEVLATLVGHQARVGLVDGSVLAQAQARAHEAAMRLPPAEAALAGTQHALESLLGGMPGSLATMLAPSPSLPPVPVSSSLVLPSELVLVRPDVRVRERAAAAATADIGMAMADLFPRFSLTGQYGVQGPEPENLGNSDTLVWSGGPQFRWLLFSMGRVWSNINLQKAQQRSAVLAYQQTVLDAMADVESKLAAWQGASHAAASAQALRTASAKAATLAGARHAAGAISGLELQEAELGALAAAQAQIQAQVAALVAYINLHQGFGL